MGFQGFLASFSNSRQDQEFEGGSWIRACFGIFNFVAGFEQDEKGWKIPRSSISGGTCSSLPANILTNKTEKLPGSPSHLEKSPNISENRPNAQKCP